MFRRMCIQAGGLLATGILAGCGGGQYANTPYLGQDGQTQFLSSPTHEVVDTISYWDGSADGGHPSITINLSEQRAYFYQGDKLAGVALVATGKEGYDTPAGTFRIMEKIADKRSDLYGYIVENGSGTSAGLSRIVTLLTTMRSTARPDASTAASEIFCTASMPSTTRAKIVYLPSMPG